MRHVLIALALVVLSPFSRAQAQETKRRLPELGLELGLYRPASSQTQAFFGSQWTAFRPRIGPLRMQSRAGFRQDFEVITSTRNGNRATIASLGGEYRQPLFGAKPSFAPYLSAGAGAYLTQTRIESLGLASSWRGTTGFSAAFGINLGTRAFIELRHREIQTVRGLNLSGEALRFGFRF